VAGKTVIPYDRWRPVAVKRSSDAELYIFNLLKLVMSLHKCNIAKSK